jgi:hypothetical protein
VTGDLENIWKVASFKVQIFAGRNDKRNDGPTFYPASYSRLEHETFITKLDF